MGNSVNHKVQEDEANRLYSLYNQDGETPLNFIPYGVEFETDDHKITVVVSARKKRKK